MFNFQNRLQIKKNNMRSFFNVLKHSIQIIEEKFTSLSVLKLLNKFCKSD